MPRLNSKRIVFDVKKVLMLYSKIYNTEIISFQNMGSVKPTSRDNDHLRSDDVHSQTQLVSPIPLGPSGRAE